jgi:hypothetical protein
MPRTLRTLAIVLLAALLPLRAVAAVTISYCAAGHQDVAVAAHSDQGHSVDSHARHAGGDQLAKPATPDCNICVEHCSSAAFAPPACQAVDAPAVSQDRTVLAARVAPAFISDQLDRPPLALLR